MAAQYKNYGSQTQETYIQSVIMNFDLARKQFVSYETKSNRMKYISPCTRIAFNNEHINSANCFN